MTAAFGAVLVVALALSVLAIIALAIVGVEPAFFQGAGG